MSFPITFERSWGSGLEKSECHSYLQEELGGSEGLQAGHLHLDFGEIDGANNPKNHLQIYKGQEGERA